MKHPSRITFAAHSLRRTRVLQPFEVNLLKAGIALRRNRGVQRDQYFSDEVEVMARARLLALQVGQIRLSRFLTLRARTKKRLAFKPGEILHECPKCGRVHGEPLRRQTKRTLAAEAQAIRAASARKG